MWQRLGMLAIVAGAFLTDLSIDDASAQVKGKSYTGEVRIDPENFEDTYSFGNRAKFTTEADGLSGNYLQIPLGVATLVQATASKAGGDSITLQGLQFMTYFIAQGTTNDARTFLFIGQENAP